MNKKFGTKVFLGVVIAFIIITVIACVAKFGIRATSKSVASLTPEQKRTMTYNLVTDESSQIDGNDFVRFNAYFLNDLDNDGYAEKYDGTCRNIAEKSLLYMDVNVLTEGKLVNGIIEVDGVNFDYSMSMIADDVLKNNYISDNVRKIELKDMNAGTQKLILGKIVPRIDNNINNYSSNSHAENNVGNNVVNSITFKGTYVPLEGEPVEVSKTVKLNVDWYGETVASMTKQSNAAKFDEEGNYEITFGFNIKEENKQLLLKENSNIVKIPELYGYAPIEVKCNNYEAECNYDESTKELTIIRESVVDENGNVRKTLSRENSYSITVKYPKAAYDAIISYDSIRFDIEGYYTGYNNKNEEFENPYKSNVVRDNIQYLINKEPTGEIFNFYVNYIDKSYFTRYYKVGYNFQDALNAYNSGNIAENKKFTVCWQAVRGNQGVVPSMIMSETKENDNYGDKWNSTIIEDYIENIGIYFTNANEFLGEDGSISVYNNDTNELIEVFTKENWNTYTSSNPYKYESGIKHIRVETSATNMNSLLNVYNIKELNTEKIMNKYTVEQFKDFTTTYTYLTGICNIDGVGAKDRKVSDSADLVYEKSNVELSLSKNTAITNEKIENEIIAINVDSDAKWKNGEFLVEIPSEIIDMEINNITIRNPRVKLEAYELFQNNYGKYFVRIITQNDEPEYYTIMIDCNLTPNPSTATVNRLFTLYAYNEMAQEYILPCNDIYDVNQNNNKAEKVGISTASIDFLAPTSLITMETVTDYDETTDAEMTVAPNVALVNKGERQATINVNLTNNYENQISDIKVIGKIPYENNTYVINGKNLYSEFTTQMTENGIKIPDELQDKAVVFYSEKTTPTNDINNVENAWKTKEDVEDWSKIISYLIYINDYIMPSKESVKFSYDIILPENINLNKASYSTHAVNFNLNTENGIIKLATEPTKVGVRIVKKYDLELTKFKINSNKTISGVRYALCYEEKNTEGEVVEKQKLISTDNEGHIFVNGLLKNYEYTLKEIEVPETVELNENETKFMINENDELTINENKKTAAFLNNKLSLELEDEIKANLIINKTKIGTNTKIDKAYFNIKGENEETKVVYTTNGQAVLNGLSLGKTYTVTEKKAQSNIEINPGVFKFKIERDGNGLQVIVEENTLLKDEYQLVNNEGMLNPELIINVEDELKYSVNIKKQDELGNNVGNVEFELLKDDNSKFKTLTSQNGTATINGLSLGKTYTLKETKAIGYFLDDSKPNSITFKVERDGELKITEFNINEGMNLVQDATITEDGLNAELSLVIENEKIPTYDLKIVKQNEDGERLSKAYFTLKRLYDNKEFKTKVNDEGEAIFNGLWEQIDGKGVTGEYELVETFAPEGYRLDTTPLRFTATRDTNGKLVFTAVSGDLIIKENSETGEKEVESDDEIVTLNIVNKPIFNIYKYGEENVLLANAKFVITDLNGNRAYGSDGKIIGTLENGRYVVTTDSNGRISANLAKGKYKAVEIEAPEGYELPVNEKDRTYYFGIEENIEPEYSKMIDEVEWVTEVDSQSSTPKGMFSVNDGFIVIYNSNITKYNKEGIKEWEKNYSDLTIYDIRQDEEGEYKITCKCSNSISYDEEIFEFEQNSNCVTLYIDTEGNYKNRESFDVSINTLRVDADDYIIINNKDVYKRNGELYFSHSTYSIKDGYVKFKTANIGFDLESTITLYDYEDNIVTSDTRKLSGNKGSNIFPSYMICNNKVFYLIWNYGSGGGYTIKCLNGGQSIDLNTGSATIPNSISVAIVNWKYKDNNTEKNGYIILDEKYVYGTDENLRLLWKDYNTSLDSISARNVADGGVYVFGRNSGELTAMGETLLNSGNTTKYYVLKYNNKIVRPESQASEEISIYNSLKQYDITTEIAQNEQGQRTGGTIAGIYNDEYIQSNNKKYVESVKHGENSTEEILIQADNGYIIDEITVNGKSIKTDSNICTTYTIKSGYFENIDENKHIIVKFAKSNYSINISKKDDNNEGIAGANFEIIKYNESNISFGQPAGRSHISTNEILSDESQLIGELTPNGTYYFEKQSDGTYKNNNQVATSSNAMSRIPLDLTGYEGMYKLVVNATMHAGTGDSAFIGDPDSPRFKGYNSSNTEINCELNLEGNKKYYSLYIYFYDSKSSSNAENNELIINSIKLYKVKSNEIGMMEKGIGYESNNVGMNNTTATTYLPLDLTNYEGKYQIKINAKINGNNNDYGYVYVRTSTYAPYPSSSESSEKMIYINGVTDNKEYYYTVNGGNMYYIHMGYVNGSTDTDLKDKFTINSITVEPCKYNVVTDSNGNASVDIKYLGEYIIKEIEAPTGYILDERPQKVTVSAENPNPTVTFTNQKASKVIVHHYLQGTGEEFENEPVVLAEEETVKGKSGAKYTTAPNMEIEGYTLIKDANNKYILPENATGTFASEEQHVYYYYNTAPVKLTVHHYLEGTEDKLADDEISSYSKGQHYKINPSDDVLEAYNLVNVVGDEEKDITQDEEVTYYYVRKQHNITTKVETISYFGKPEKGGEITGEGENPYETVPHGTSNIKPIKMTPNQGFKIDQIVINQLKDGQVLSSEKLNVDFNIDDTYDLPQIQNIVNDYEIVVRFVPDMGKVIVHHYIEGTQISIAPDEVIIDEYGNVVETKPVDDTEYETAENYRRYVLVQSPADQNVVISREDQEVIYYYNIQYKVTTEVIAHDESENGETVHVKGGSISGENDKPYEVVARENNSNKEIKITPDEDYKIVEIKINGETFDFTEELAEDGTVTLDKFTNMLEDKHVTVEFERIYREIPAKVIVKYLEEGTNKELKSEDIKEGIVGKEYKTTRAVIDGYEKNGEDPINGNGTMTEEDIVVIYYYKKIQEVVEPITETGTNESINNAEENGKVEEKNVESVKSLNNTKNASKSPQTGDNVLIITIIGGLAVVAFILVKPRGKHFE